MPPKGSNQTTGRAVFIRINESVLIETQPTKLPIDPTNEMTQHMQLGFALTILEIRRKT